MKKIVLSAAFLFSIAASGQNIGIGTTLPNTDGALHIHANQRRNGFLITGTTAAFDGTERVPDLGSGPRLMFFPAKRVFRAGAAFGTEWDNINCGYGSVALGIGAIASSSNSFAAGTLAKAGNVSAVALGESATAIGLNSTAIGAYTVAVGPGAVAIGTQNLASGNYSLATGLQTSSSASYSFTAGIGTTARGFASTVVGAFNDSLQTFTEFSLTPSTPLFVVGNGATHSQRSNALVVRGNGTTEFGGRLTLRGQTGNTDQTAGIWLNNINNTTTTGFIGVYSNNQMGFFGSTGAAWGFLFNTTNGNATLSGTLTQNSDARLKKNILPLRNSVQKLQMLNGYQYNWKAENADTASQTGLLAQEVQAVFPELVKENDKGVLSVNYMGLIPHLLEAIKDQQKRVNDQQLKIDWLMKEVTELKKQTTTLSK